MASTLLYGDRGRSSVGQRVPDVLGKSGNENLYVGYVQLLNSTKKN